APRLVRPAADHGEPRDRAGVQVVVPVVAVGGAAELAALHGELARGVVAGEQAHLVVDEARVAHGELAALEADTGAVAAGHPRAHEIEALDLELAVADHPDALALGRVA